MKRDWKQLFLVVILFTRPTVPINYLRDDPSLDKHILVISAWNRYELNMIRRVNSLTAFWKNICHNKTKEGLALASRSRKYSCKCEPV